MHTTILLKRSQHFSCCHRRGAATHDAQKPAQACNTPPKAQTLSWAGLRGSQLCPASRDRDSHRAARGMCSPSGKRYGVPAVIRRRFMISSVPKCRDRDSRIGAGELLIILAGGS